MENLTRRQMLQAGAAGTLAAGIATMTRPMAAAADPVGRKGGLHIHASLKELPDSTLGGALDRIVNIDVFGADDDLSGAGWDADTGDEIGQPNRGDASQCYYTQRGSVSGDSVALTGVVLFFVNPADNGAKVTTTANLATGEVSWVFEPRGGGAFKFGGTGVVVRL